MQWQRGQGRGTEVCGELEIDGVMESTWGFVQGLGEELDISFLLDHFNLDTLNLMWVLFSVFFFYVMFVFGAGALSV